MRGILMNYENETRDFGEDDYDEHDAACLGNYRRLSGGSRSQCGR